MTSRRPRRRAQGSSCRTTPAAVDTLLAGMAERGSVRRAATAAATGAAFRATVEQRLKALEADLGEVKSRLNGLLFLVAGAVLTQVILQLLRR